MDRVSVVDSYVYDDGNEKTHKDVFEREPFVVRFASTKTCKLINVELKLTKCLQGHVMPHFHSFLHVFLIN